MKDCGGKIMPMKQDQKHPVTRRVRSSSTAAFCQGKSLFRVVPAAILVFVLVRCTIPGSEPAVLWAETKTPEQVEYEIKAAFIYNFMRFIDWPEGKHTANRKYQTENDPDVNREKPPPPPLLIGIVGRNPFGQAFVPVLDRKINERELGLVYIDELGPYLAAAKTEVEAIAAYRKKNAVLLSRCDVLFICTSEDKHLETLLTMIAGSAAVTISDIPRFGLRGGMIEFVMDSKRVRFDINLDRVKEENLKIRSQLLELARRIHKTADNPETKGHR